MPSPAPPLVLAVEDSLEAARLVERAVAGAVRLRWVRSLAAAREALAEERPDVVLLDLCLPDGEGFELCSELRSAAATSDLPILFLTARGNTADKLAAFSLGADDYLVKPFHPLELRARVDALLRRARAAARSVKLLRLGDLEIDFSRLRVTIAGPDRPIQVALTAHEFRLLGHLATHADHVFSRGQLVAAVWGGTIVSTRTVDSHVSNLRRKLGRCGLNLESVRGVGYRLHAGSAQMRGSVDGAFSTENGSAVENEDPKGESRTSEGERRTTR